MTDEQETNHAFARSLSNAGLGIVCLLVQKEYKPGDLPPKDGYLAWHEWAEVQYRAGIKQKRCKKCGKRITPQEVNGHMAQHFTDGIALDAILA
ncbi:MAG: hypothetical protein ACD_21C00115G0001 [uncultured bacterium]|nr:MAG: hypothetical protein ACD_21C00115G0001 [uncultured bacterium]